MASDVRRHVTTCVVCQKMKFSAQPGYGFMHMRFWERPGRCLSIDIVVLNDGTSLLTMLDCFAHYPDAQLMVDMTAESCAKALLSWVHKFGVPEEVRADRGLNLNLSAVFKALYALLGIKGQLSHAWSPQSNQVERFHRWLGASFRVLFHERNFDVVDSLGPILWIYRSTPCAVTGFTPNLLMCGWEPRFPTDVFDGSNTIDTSSNEYVEHIQSIMKDCWDVARSQQMLAQEVSAKAYNEKHGVQPKILVGDKVFLKYKSRNLSDKSSKLIPQCSGPWIVRRINSKGSLLKHTITGEEKSANNRHIKKAYIRDESEVEGPSCFKVNDFVVIKIFSGQYKWSLAKLLETNADQKLWTARWYGTKGANRLDKEFKPAWYKFQMNGAYMGEIYSIDMPKTKGFYFEEIIGAVKAAHFIPESFTVAAGAKCKLPAPLRATLSIKWPKEHL